MSLMPRIPSGYYDDKGEWQRRKFCLVDCGERCTCKPPYDAWYSAAHDKRKMPGADTDTASATTESIQNQSMSPTQAHYPEEWGPSDDRRLTCVCGNPDPDHVDRSNRNGPAEPQVGKRCVHEMEMDACGYSRCNDPGCPKCSALNGKTSGAATSETTQSRNQQSCPNCGSIRVTETIISHTFQYGIEPYVVNVPVTEPVLHCMECSQEWTDYRGEDARSEATIRALYREVQSLLAFKASIAEALNGGDGSYRP